ncbi:MAG: ATP phosphoribosyltransferase regulatory subunit [Clostridia bacterium]|nr:ATP phosphoribosyltransferase regulatory subunit [Clostridia bacterium]
MMELERIRKALTRDELAVYSLRALYNEYGYGLYKMSKFEEYDFYARNKDFLVSENIITFTDTDGRLLALKPDVTLSIIKNSKVPEGGELKLCYNENVYRVGGGTGTFKEIMQVGLEHIGRVDSDTIIEVMTLAKKSLDLISDSNVLEVSNLDIAHDVLAHFGLTKESKARIYSYLGRKSVCDILSVCTEEGLDASARELISSLATVYGSTDKVLPLLDSFKLNERLAELVDGFADVIRTLSDRGVEVVVDFSLMNDMNYYNGVAFKGFVDGIPVGILCGGEYKNLMNKMKRKESAIGFAVYLDELEKLP